MINCRRFDGCVQQHLEVVSSYSGNTQPLELRPRLPMFPTAYLSPWPRIAEDSCSASLSCPGSGCRDMFRGFI